MASGGSSGNRNRQKMINLMYLVFIAMVALNVSSDVLAGFDKVGEGLAQMLATTTERNDRTGMELQLAYNHNPDKAATACSGQTDTKCSRLALPIYRRTQTTYRCKNGRKGWRCK